MTRRRRPARALRPFLVHRVIVNCTDGTSFVGSLWDADELVVVLKGVTVHPAGKAAVEVPGDVIIQVRTISFIQAPGDHP